MRSLFSLPRRSVRGFTLIELLVVISIIAILAGLLLPVVSSVMNSAHKAEAKSTCAQIVTAVKNYFTEYGQYPIEPQSPAVDATFDNNSANSSGEYGHNHILFDVLRANNASSSDNVYAALNSKKTVYFEYKDVKNTANAKSGFIPADPNPTPKANISALTVEAGDLMDPFGNLYYVRMDGNYSGVLENPYESGTSDSAGTNASYKALTDTPNTTTFQSVLQTDVVAWSPGADGCMGTKGGTPAISPTSVGDDVLSWQ